jgi:hypothetical protein
LPGFSTALVPKDAPLAFKSALFTGFGWVGPAYEKRKPAGPRPITMKNPAWCHLEV